LILYCFRFFQEKPWFEVDQKYQIFKLMLEKDNHFDNYSSVVEKVLSRINVALLNTFQNIVKIDLGRSSEDEESGSHC
jgi:hypothetical protein